MSKCGRNGPSLVAEPLGKLEIDLRFLGVLDIIMFGWKILKLTNYFHINLKRGVKPWDLYASIHGTYIWRILRAHDVHDFALAFSKDVHEHNVLF
jgi:hypothetical protein